MQRHNPFLEHIHVLRCGVETEEAITVLDHRGELNPHNGSVLSVCVDGLAIHLTVRQSKALRKALKALEAGA